MESDHPNSLGALLFSLILFLSKDSFCSFDSADLQWWYLTDTTTSVHFSKPRTDLVIKQQNHPKMIIESKILPIERENVRQKNKNKHLWEEKKT